MELPRLVVELWQAVPCVCGAWRADAQNTPRFWTHYPFMNSLAPKRHSPHSTPSDFYAEQATLSCTLCLLLSPTVCHDQISEQFLKD
ncbi:uncharacterized protein SCHCODRAFT_02633931 [Schizophyllum commune H4-8]|uniref:uncharacterized protein n=1 Tax=Schizophyllum commune (strain H4-8 / FGSC 9210) TaxID=578458 RepID=UPI00215E0500|nr:uncharacterized protein SCHCODRAFT_02633931 [Schizophyllum commune H4-8]KAI5889232.1 hypothetical protein SCHCODRAFT_02633931 [Schizophyllum commune H4-8]